MIVNQVLDSLRYEYERKEAEIRLLRAAVAAADRLHADTMYKLAPEAKDAYIKARAALSAGDSHVHD